MAFALPLDPHDTGIVSRYWRITAAHLDHMAHAATIWLHGWTDEAARTAGRIPAAAMTLVLHEADLAGASLHLADTAALYTALKTRAQADAAALGKQAGALGEQAAHADARVGHAIADLAAAVDC